ncbi:hypothetical protein EIP86_004627 [Pleurotus ostreatoroseus]|nr:hypothetical protein EIP86_004627 [Pleurotus ostreatoroseus]
MLELQQQHPHFLFNTHHDHHLNKHAAAPDVAYLPSPPSDQSASEHDSPSPPATLPYNPIYNVQVPSFQPTYDQYDHSAHSASPPITPTDDQPFLPHYTPAAADSMRRLSVPAMPPPLAPSDDAYTRNTHQYSPRPSNAYAYPDRDQQWDHAPSAYQSDNGPLTTQPLASTSSASQQHAQMQATQSQQTLPPLASLDAGMQTATGAIISTHHVQTALPGVPVEVAGGLPTHPPIPVPPLAGPASPPALPGMVNHPARLKKDDRRASLTGPGAAGGREERDRERGGRDREGKEGQGAAGEGAGKDGKGKSSKQYAFVELPGNAVKKRPRRRYDEIERLYRCK